MESIGKHACELFFVWAAASGAYRLQALVSWCRCGPKRLERDLIALPLFDGSAKYCEATVLKVLERARLYLRWVCHF